MVPPSEKDLVKRVIAIGGQTVRCCDDNGNVQVSDHGATGPWRSLNEPYIYQNSSLDQADHARRPRSRTTAAPSGRSPCRPAGCG